MPTAPRVSGRFEIVSQLGQGGMGEVWAATDLQLERKVALKAIRSEFRLDPVSRVRFLREARALSKLEHQSICRIYDYIEGDDQDFLVLELIEGVSLRERLKARLDEAAALRIAEQVGDALAAAHAVGLIHRDLKPGNVMITRGGDAKILDFGLARAAVEEFRPATGTAEAVLDPGPDDETFASPTPVSALAAPATLAGRSVGTPLYMSPEQAQGKELGSASDMFSYGLLLHEMFTGEPAYDPHSGDALLKAIARGETRPVRGIDRHLAVLISQLESSAPSRRPTAVDATARLRRIRAKPQRRMRWAIAGLVAVFALGAAAKYTLDLRRERAAAEFRRSQADGHIEFMVEELYEKLEPVGRLDVLEEVGAKALAYFDTLDESEQSDEDRARRARTLTQIGHVHLALGDPASAEEAFERSLVIHADLVARDPTESRWAIGLGGAHFGRGSVAWVEEALDRAGAEFGAYLDIANGLILRDPENPTHQLELGYALTNMAALHEATGDRASAIVELERAIEIKRKLVGADPGNREYLRSLANTHGWLAQVLEAHDARPAALPHFESALELQRQLAKDPSDNVAQGELSTALNGVGLALQHAGNWEAAERLFQEDIAISQRLQQLDPANSRWQYGLATSWGYLGVLLLERARFDEARPLLERSFTESRARLVLNDPDQDWTSLYDYARYRLALLEFREARLGESERVLADGPPPDTTAGRARVAILQGRIARKRGRAAEATAHWEEAQRVLDADTDSDSNPEEIRALRKNLADSRIGS